MADGNALIVPDGTGVAGRLRLARMAAGLSRQELAASIGISPRTYERLENGSREPRRSELIRIAQVTGQDLSFFWGASLDGQEQGATVSPLPDVVKRGDGE